MDLAPGRRLGRYQIVRRLGGGGSADVYLARRAELHGGWREVVLKVLAARRSVAEIERFQHAARVAAAIRHPHVAHAIEVGCEDGLHFLALEYVRGVTLSEVLAAASASRRELPYEVALSVVVAAASGLHHAHRRRGAAPGGAPHRDVSGADILVGYDGAVKLIDAGVAPTDPRRAVRALAVIAYEATTQIASGVRAARPGGRRLEGSSPGARGSGALPPPSALRPGYPPALAAVLLRALAIDPGDRLPTAAAFADALARAAGTLGFVLGRAPVADAMEMLFPEPARRPSLARGSGRIVAADDAATVPVPTLRRHGRLDTDPPTLPR